MMVLIEDVAFISPYAANLFIFYIFSINMNCRLQHKWSLILSPLNTQWATVFSFTTVVQVVYEPGHPVSESNLFGKMAFLSSHD